MPQEQPHRLLQRLDAIAASLAQSGYGLALIGLGSVGTELNRLDHYSDLDFFAIVEPGHKAAFIEDLAWLEAVCPIAYAFQNTRDGQKVLFTDGIFVEFAVFVPVELEHIPYDEGRVVWQKDGFDATAVRAPAPHPEEHPREFYLGEALTNLYVGLLRLHRGEHLSAMRFIQVYAVNNLLELSAQIAPPTCASRDRYAPERRYEQRFPEMAPHLSSFIQGYGYERSQASARAILRYLEDHFPVNVGVKHRILELCGEERPA